MNAESDERNGGDAPAPPEAAAGDVAKGERELGSRAPGFIKASRVLHVSWQVGIFVVGLAVVAAGVVDVATICHLPPLSRDKTCRL